MLCNLKGAGHFTAAKRMTSILRHVAEAFHPARQGTILNNHRVILHVLYYCTYDLNTIIKGFSNKLSARCKYLNSNGFNKKSVDSVQGSLNGSVSVDIPILFIYN